LAKVPEQSIKVHENPFHTATAGGFSPGRLRS
jgi:hypothetical protein